MLEETELWLMFPKDSSHKSDWEWAIIKWKSGGNDQWVRDSLLLETDGSYGGGAYSDVPNTFTE
jgi:hypothetical protein